MEQDSEKLTAAAYICGEASDDCAEFATKFTIVPFSPDAILFRRGSTCDALYIVLTGAVRLISEHANGSPRLVGVLTQRDEYGSSILFDGGRHPATGIAHTDVRAALLARADLFREIETNPRAARHVLALLQRHVESTEARLQDLVTVDVGGRVARTMLELARKFGVPDGTGVHVCHNLTQVEYAHLVGASRETVNKCLHDFTARGWLRLNRHSVTILDEVRLAQRASGIRRGAHHRQTARGGRSAAGDETDQCAV